VPMARPGPNNAAVPPCSAPRNSVVVPSLVVVGSWCRPALSSWATLVGSVEGLDLALVIDTKDQRFVRRIDVKPDHSYDVGGEVRPARF
jgi:hypothetical protein